MIFERIVAEIPHGREVKSTWLHSHGGIVLSPAEGAALEELYKHTHGDHVDIGTYFGGSSILAALCKPDGMIYSIDSQLSEHWEDKTVTVEKVMENIRHFGVENRIVLIKANSHPLPIQKPVSTVFIDGDERDDIDTGGVLHDWQNAAELAQEYVIFHDCRELYKGVLKTVGLATCDPRWKLIECVDSLRIFKRK